MNYDFLTNIIVVLFFCGVVILIELYLNKKYSHYFLGVIFGLITIFVMYAKIMVADGRYFDFRHIIMTMAGYIGGPVTATIAALISSLYRFNVGGSGSMGGISSIIFFGCFGSILARFVRNSQNEKKVWFWFITGFVIELVHLLIIAFIHPGNSDSATVLRIVSVPFLIITPLATSLIFNFYYWVYGFFGKASILNTIINKSDINLMLYDSKGPILLSKNLKEQSQITRYLENSCLLLDTDKTWLNTPTQQLIEISTGEGKHFDVDLSSFYMPNGEYTYLAIVNDVTDRKREQKELTSIVENMIDGFFTIDEDWQFTYVNRAGEISMGKNREELLTKKMTEVFMLNNSTLQNFHKVIRDRKPITFEIISAAIGNKWLEVCAYPKEGGLTCFFRDITRRKKAEQEFARLDRLNLVGQMAAGIGHEIRNPMTTVRGYLQLLGSKPKNADQKPTFDLMISELDRANSIITEYLALTKTRPCEPKIKNINEVLDKLYPLIEADAFNQNKEIRFYPIQVPNIELDEKEISQLILNLSRNGLEAMEERGTLIIHTYSEGNHVVLKISDEGCGIPSENLDKMGIPFFTTKETGTGLGLATSYTIADSHKAKIDIDSSHEGTTIYVRFPIPD